MDAFPPNSRKAEQHPPTAKKRVEPVVSASDVRRKQSLGKRFSHVFFGGDARTAVEYAAGNVLVPMVKDAMFQVWSSAIERLIYGDTHPRRHSLHTPPSGPQGHVAYNAMRPGNSQPSVSRTSRSRQQYDDIILPNRPQAQEVLERMYDLLSQYDAVSVADLLELTGQQTAHTDHKWGWMDLRGSRVERTRDGGYILNLPKPVYFE